MLLAQDTYLRPVHDRQVRISSVRIHQPRTNLVFVGQHESIQVRSTQVRFIEPGSLHICAPEKRAL